MERKSGDLFFYEKFLWEVKKIREVTKEEKINKTKREKQEILN